MKEIIKKIGRLFLLILPVALMVVSMCILKLWYSIFIVFSIGLALTLIFGKRNYCKSYCPLGNLQELMYEKNKKRRKLPAPKVISIIIALLFWAYILFVVIFFRKSPGMLWSWLLKIMLLSSVTAIILQMFFSKRVWCSTLCPYGNFLGYTAKLRNLIFRKNKKSKS